MIEQVSYEDLYNGKARDLLAKRKSFEICDLDCKLVGDGLDLIEYLIESSGLSCRIHNYRRVSVTRYRFFSVVMGGLSAVGMALRNLLTFNPDYDVAWHQWANKLSVSYKKE